MQWSASECCTACCCIDAEEQTALRGRAAWLAGAVSLQSASRLSALADLLCSCCAWQRGPQDADCPESRRMALSCCHCPCVRPDDDESMPDMMSSKLWTESAAAVPLNVPT